MSEQPTESTDASNADLGAPSGSAADSTSGSNSSSSPPESASSPSKPRARPARKTNVPTGKSTVQLSTGPDLKKWAPYIAAVATIGAVYGLAQIPRFTAPASLAGAMIVCALLGWAAASHRISLSPDDGLRKLMVPATIGIVLACAAPIAWTVYPPAPKGTVELREVGQRVDLDLGSGVDLWATIRGQVDRNATGNADFSIAATNGAQREDIRGRLRVLDHGMTERRNLALRGPGVVHFELRGIAAALTPPLRLTIHARPVPARYMAILAVLLVALAVGIDSALRNRGMEPAYAAALCPLVVAMMYLTLRPVGGEDVPTSMLAAGMLGLLVGGLGGEGLGRLARSLTR